MKKTIVISLLVFLACSVLMAQNSGKGFNFQAVARNSDGSVKAEQTIQLLISIYPSFDKTAVLYSENNAANTDKFGVFSLVVGHGVFEAGSASSFEEIDFSSVDAYLNVMLKEGGSEIEIVHAPLLSVPYAESSRQADNGMPIGSIIPYAGDLSDNTDDVTVYGCKGTWRLCNGAEYDPAIFIELHQVLNNAWGSNSLPDLRGTFLRGTNYSAGDAYADPDKSNRVSRNGGGNVGNKVGSYQGDELKNHTHYFNDTYNTSTRVKDDGALKAEDAAHPNTTTKDNTTAGSGGSETRPKNANVNFIIRIK